METNEKLRNESIASVKAIKDHATIKRVNLMSTLFWDKKNKESKQQQVDYWDAIITETNQELEFRIKNIFG